ncbi:hypothetical protein [Telluribacter sp. SYSU D00476]|uniref:hypothetical protein n=1 Tax=Telluribacter sp. SYSU D00476 TaxID=2811430 RepID=UPI001FF69CB4|nr:hypothetical protein [Telluribacter sp. SYSU D00476]
MRYTLYQLLMLMFIISFCPVSSYAQDQHESLPVDQNGNVNEDKLSPKQLRDFQELVELKVAEFQNFLSIISDPKQSDQTRELAIENALRLFMPNSTMQVGSVKNKTLIKEYPLSIYLRRLKNLEKKYFDISITFYDLALINDWEKTNTGYVTTATYFQRFQGKSRDGKIMYEDKTSKNMDVDLRNRKDPFYEENKWTVLLGDIRVAEITPKKSVQ